YCRKRLTFESSTVDHARPLSRGGRDDRANLRICCGWCNRRKGDRTPDEFDAPDWSSRWQYRQRRPFCYAGRLWLSHAADEIHRRIPIQGDLLRIVRIAAAVRHIPDTDTCDAWIDAEFGWRGKTVRRFCRTARLFRSVGQAPGTQWRALYALSVQTL